MWAESSSHVQNGNLDSFGSGFATSIEFSRNSQIRASNIGIDEQGQIVRVDMVFEVFAINVNQIMIAFLG